MRVVSIHIISYVCLALKAQAQAIYRRTHGSQLGLRSSYYANDAYFVETTASACADPAEYIITPEQCDEAAGFSDSSWGTGEIGIWEVTVQNGLS